MTAQQPQDSTEPNVPEPKSPTEPLDVQRKAEAVWRGEAPVPDRYPYILPDYLLPFPHLGTETQLFLDNVMLEWLDGLERVLERPTKHPEPVLRPDDFPWESYGGTSPAVLYDEQDRLFKMWYHVLAGGSDTWSADTLICYAESDDGVHWRKPTDRGGLPFPGHDRTNIVLADAGWHSVLKEPAEPDPARRYKLVFWDNRPEGNRFGVAYSADGYRAERTAVTPYRLSHNTGVFWDPAIRKYVSYGQYGHHWNYLRRRAIGRQESDDLLRWSPREEVLAPDGDDDPSIEYGEMTVHKEGSLYVGNVTRYPMEPIWQVARGAGPRYNWRDFTQHHRVLAYSRDGRCWSIAGNRQTWIDNGPPGSPFFGHMEKASAPVRFNGRLYIYQFAARHRQGWSPGMAHFEQIVPRSLRQLERFPALSYADWGPTEVVGLVTLRQDGYVRVQPRYREGTLLTSQFVFEGDRLYLNLLSEFGHGRVEVLDDEMEPIPGFAWADCDPVRGDSISHEVRWRGNADVRPLWNRPIRLRIYLNDAWLYAFRFGYADRP